MTYKIHFTYPDGTEDYFVVSGDTHDEIGEKARNGVAERNGTNPWSEEVE